MTFNLYTWNTGILVHLDLTKVMYEGQSSSSQEEERC